MGWMPRLLDSLPLLTHRFCLLWDLRCPKPVSLQELGSWTWAEGKLFFQVLIKHWRGCRGGDSLT